jgi:hypothetical protein
MYVSRRDYILRLVEEITQLVARIVFQRERNRPQEALQSLVQACERLFVMDADRLFQFTPDQHFAMLQEGETPEAARDKVLLFASLNREAGLIYGSLGNATMARASFQNALRFVLKAENSFPRENWPAFAPPVDELMAQLKEAPLDADVESLLRARV